GLLTAGRGCIDIARGGAVAFSPQFDEVRSIILGAPFHGYFVMERTGKPHESVQFTHCPMEVKGKPTVWAMADVFGASMATDLLVRRAGYFNHDPKLLNVMEF